MKFFVAFAAVMALTVAVPVRRPEPLGVGYLKPPMPVGPVVFGDIPEGATPLVQIIVNVNKGTSEAEPITPVLRPEPIGEIPSEPVHIVDDAPEPVQVGDVAPIAVEPVQIVDVAPIAVEPVQIVDVAPIAVEPVQIVDVAPIAVEPVQIVDVAPIAVEPVQIVDVAPIAIEPVQVVDSAPIPIEPVQIGVPIIPEAAVILPEELN